MLRLNIKSKPEYKDNTEYWREALRGSKSWRNHHSTNFTQYTQGKMKIWRGRKITAMKKSLVQLLASMVLVSLSFCASAATTLEFLEVMTSPERTQLLKSMIAEYEELNPEIKINLISPPYEQSEQKATLMRVSQRLSGQGLSPMLMLEVY